MLSAGGVLELEIEHARDIKSISSLVGDGDGDDDILIARALGLVELVGAVPVLIDAGDSEDRVALLYLVPDPERRLGRFSGRLGTDDMRRRVVTADEYEKENDDKDPEPPFFVKLLLWLRLRLRCFHMFICC